MRTAMNEDESTRVAPDTNKWGLPYGHFPIGELFYFSSLDIVGKCWLSSLTLPSNTLFFV